VAVEQTLQPTHHFAILGLPLEVSCPRRGAPHRRGSNLPASVEGCREARGQTVSVVGTFSQASAPKALRRSSPTVQLDCLLDYDLTRDGRPAASAALSAPEGSMSPHTEAQLRSDPRGGGLQRHEVSEWAGQASVAFTMTRYGGLFDDDTDAAVDHLDDLLKVKASRP